MKEEEKKNNTRKRSRFKIKNFAFACWVIVAITVIGGLGAIIGAKIAFSSVEQPSKKEVSVFDGLKYDIIIRANQESIKETDSSEEGTGNTVNSKEYFYVLINSKEEEQYRITYTNYEDNNKYGYDTVTFSKSPIMKSEIDLIPEEYEHLDKAKSVRALIESNIEEKYVVVLDSVTDIWE